jgi:hypothetical protein
VEDRYYSEAQYNAFMPAQRKQLWDIRSKRGSGNGKDKGKGKDGGGSGPRKGPHSLKKVISALRSLLVRSLHSRPSSSLPIFCLSQMTLTLSRRRATGQPGAQSAEEQEVTGSWGSACHPCWLPQD